MHTSITRSDAEILVTQDGTVNFLAMSSVEPGISLLSKHRYLIPLRLAILLHYTATELYKIVHAKTGAPLVRICSPNVASLPDGEGGVRQLSKTHGGILTL